MATVEPDTKKPKTEPVKKALVTGITGQDGSYLAEFLLEKVPKLLAVTKRGQD